MSAARFYSALPREYQGNDRRTVAYFVYYLVEEQGKSAASALEVHQCFVDCDISPPSRIASYLSEGLKGDIPQFVKAKGAGYRLERSRKAQIAKTLGVRERAVQTSAELRALEGLITDPVTKEYLSEAIDCFDAGANRGAVIMTWVLTMDHFLNYIFREKLAEFNRVLAQNPDRKIKVVDTRETFQELNEDRIIELARAAKIITSDIQKVLKDGLGTRNSAAHPSDVKIAKSKTIAIIEDLVINVIRKF